MGGDLALAVQECRRQKRAPAFALALAIAGLALSAVPADAQDASAATDGQNLSSSSSGAGCTIEQTLADAGPQVLLVSCRGHTLVLGPATSYQAFPNDSLEAMIVDLRNGDLRRLVLLSFTSTGQPRLEDIGGAVLLDGASELAAVTDLDIDFSEFAANGRLYIHSPAADQLSSASPAVIRVGDYIVRTTGR